MAESKKVPEWKLITEAKHKIDANQTVRLRAARLAREAAEPPAPPAKKRAARLSPPKLTSADA